MPLEYTYRYIKAIFIEPKQKIIAILKLNKIFKFATLENHYHFSSQQEYKWDPHEKGIEIKPEVLLDNEWNPLELHDVNFSDFN